MLLPEQLAIDLFVFLAAFFGFATAILAALRNGKKIDRTQDAIGGQLQEIHLLVNSNLARVQADLSAAVARIEELDHALSGVAHAARSVPDQTATGALRETLAIADAAAPPAANHQEAP